MWKPNLRKFWEEQRPNVVWYVLGLIVTAAAGRIATLTHGIEAWLVFFLVLFLAWAVIATAIATKTRHTGEARSTEDDDSVTTENIEDRINDWIHNFRLTSQKLDDAP